MKTRYWRYFFKSFNFFTNSIRIIYCKYYINLFFNPKPSCEVVIILTIIRTNTTKISTFIFLLKLVPINREELNVDLHFYYYHRLSYLMSTRKGSFTIAPSIHSHISKPIIKIKKYPSYFHNIYILTYSHSNAITKSNIFNFFPYQFIFKFLLLKSHFYYSPCDPLLFIEKFYLIKFQSSVIN